MKSIWYFLFCIVFVNLVFGQTIPNAGFESWATNVDPIDWSTSNAAPAYTNVTQSTIAHTGTYAARGEAILFYTAIIGPVVQSGSDAKGFAISERPISITGYYQYFPTVSSGDRFGVNVGLYKGGVDGIAVAIAANVYSSATSGYSLFTVPFVYFTSDTPDVCIIQIQIVGPGVGEEAKPHAGSYYLLDDLAFSNEPMGVNDISATPVQFSIQQNYPNPFNPSTTIRYMIDYETDVKLDIYNALGQNIVTLVNERQISGIHTVKFDARNLPSGVYFSRISVGGETRHGKMLLVK